MKRSSTLYLLSISSELLLLVLNLISQQVKHAYNYCSYLPTVSLWTKFIVATNPYINIYVPF